MTTTEAPQQERVLISENSKAINEARESKEKLFDMLEKAMQRWYAMNLPVGMTPQWIWDKWVGGTHNVKSNVAQVEKFIRALIYDHSDFFKSAPISKETALSMIQLPEGFGAFAGSLDSLAYYKEFIGSIHTAIPMEFFLWDQQDLQLLFNELKFEAWLDHYRRYATSKEVEALTDLKEIEALLDKFSEKYPSVELLLRPKGSDEPNAVFYTHPHKGTIVFNRRNLRLPEVEQTVEAAEQELQA